MNKVNIKRNLYQAWNYHLIYMPGPQTLQRSVNSTLNHNCNQSNNACTTNQNTEFPTIQFWCKKFQSLGYNQ